MSAVEEVLANLELKKGGHGSFEAGTCLLEAVSYVAGERFSDHPECVSEVLGSFGRRLNDLLDDESRQKLKPFIPGMLNTANDGQDQARRWLATDWAVRVATPRLLDAAGLTEHAENMRALAPVVDYETAAMARTIARAARDDAYLARTKARASLRDRIREELVKRGLPAAAAAADVAAAAAADVDVAAAAAAAADVDVAAAAAADVAAAAAADVDVDVAAAADHIQKTGKTDYWSVYYAVRDAVKAKVTEALTDTKTKYGAIRAINNAEAIELFGRMIDPKSNA